MSRLRQTDAFFRWVDEHRRAQNLSRHQLTGRAGLDASYWRVLESGETHPRRETVEAIAKALGQPAAEALVFAGYLPDLDPEARGRVLAALGVQA